MASSWAKAKINKKTPNGELRNWPKKQEKWTKYNRLTSLTKEKQEKKCTETKLAANSRNKKIHKIMIKKSGRGCWERRKMPLNHRLLLPPSLWVIWESSLDAAGQSWNHQSGPSGKVKPPTGQRQWNRPIYITKWWEEPPHKHWNNRTDKEYNHFIYILFHFYINFLNK